MRPNRARERPAGRLLEVPRPSQRPGAALGALPPPLHADHRRQTPPRQLLPHRLATQVSWIEFLYSGEGRYKKFSLVRCYWLSFAVSG